MTRLKNTLAEDLIAARKDIERLSDHNLRLNKEKEELTKDRGNLVIDLTGSERDNQTLNSVRTSRIYFKSYLYLLFRQSVVYVLSMSISLVLFLSQILFCFLVKKRSKAIFTKPKQ